LSHRLLRDASFHRRLFELDADLATQARAGGCRLCGGVLHQADYPRKPRGAPAGLGPIYERRHSFCCASEDCRRRLTPRSLRFLDGRVYTSVVATLAALLAHGLSRSRCRKLCTELEVDPRTLERWQQWWREDVPRTDFWTELRGGLDRPVDLERLPCSLLERIHGACEEQRLVALLRLMSPLSHSALMRQRLARAA
jgi:hypothetical protein